MRQALPVFWLIAVCAMFVSVPLLAQSGVVINEVQLRNDGSIKDQNGEADPWIELYNNSTDPVDLSGWHLSNDAGSLTQWTFPNGTTISGRDYLIVWVDGDEGQDGLHTNFTLAPDKTLFLVQSDLVVADSVRYQSKFVGGSYVRVPNGRGGFASMYPTFGENNQNRPAGTPAINELLVVNTESTSDQDGEFDSWIELVNNGGPTDVDGFYLSTDANNLKQWKIPDQTMIPRNGVLVIWVDGDSTQEGLHTNFTLDEAGGTLILSLNGEVVWDFVEYGPQSEDVAYARIPNGTGSFTLQGPTFNQNNEARQPGKIVINEFLAVNTATQADQDGEFDPWIELYNTSKKAVDISGWELSYITGNGSLLDEWWFPSGTVIPGNGYLIVWADNDEAQDGLHTNFELQALGENLILSEPDGFQVDEVEFRQQSADIAYARVPNGTGRFLFQDPTFKDNNGLKHPGKVVINEILVRNRATIADQNGEFDPWIELYNNSNREVHIGGWYLTDDLNNVKKWEFPDGTMIPANDYLVVWADNDEGQDGLHTNFILGGGRTKLYFIEPDLFITDSVDYSGSNAMRVDVAFGRVPNGTGGFMHLGPTFKDNNQNRKVDRLVINELVVVNTESTADQDGEFDSWVEIYNNSTESIQLSTFYLSTDVKNIKQWKFPSGTVIPQKGYLTVWLDGDTTQDGLHANFTLDEMGGTLILSSTTFLDMDFVEFGAQSEDVALARVPNGMGAYTSQPATFNADNDVPPPSKVVINEFVASNKESAADQNGEFDDWIELYNNSNKPFDISGWYLSDDANKLDQWEFPSGTIIPPHSYLIVWADDEEGQAGLHTNFTLSLAGETLILSRPNLFLADSVKFGPQSTDIAYARMPNGTGEFVLQWATFNQNNENRPPSKVVINEILPSNTKSTADQNGEFDDWIELYNKTGVDIHLGGWYLTDDGTDLTQWQFPDGTIIPGNGYLIVWADDDEGQEGLHASFTLSLSGETLYLLEPDLFLADSVEFGAQDADITYARVPDGTGAFLLRPPTFNRDNEILTSVEFSHSQQGVLRVYPNPVERTLHLSSRSTDMMEVKILNLLGVEEARVRFRGESSVDVSDLPAGVYFIASGSTVYQILVQ